MKRPIKVIIAKLGLDIHWRGAMVVARFLKDAGMEVIYLGNQFPKEIVTAALQESVDVVALSTLGGNHLTLGPKVIKLLRDKGLNDILVVMGGVIPPEDIPVLKSQGFDEIFTPHTSLKEAAEFIRERVYRREESQKA
jgi:methylmalonyl-CoA mutase C-terminal domain/subunit